MFKEYVLVTNEKIIVSWVVDKTGLLNNISFEIKGSNDIFEHLVRTEILNLVRENGRNMNSIGISKTNGILHILERFKKEDGQLVFGIIDCAINEYNSLFPYDAESLEGINNLLKNGHYGLVKNIISIGELINDSFYKLLNDAYNN